MNTGDANSLSAPCVQGFFAAVSTGLRRGGLANVSPQQQLQSRTARAPTPMHSAPQNGPVSGALAKPVAVEISSAPPAKTMPSWAPERV